MFETKSTTVPITKEMVKEAYRKVRSNQGSAGVDKESLEDFQADLLNNLYKLWNRLSSGSYFPQPVREVSIPKANGSQRILGIPTVSDRIAQQVIKDYLEPRLEAIFSKNSYGYRPLKSAHDAVEEVRKNVRQYAWVIDMDIKSFFDEVSHELLLKGLDCHVEEKWVKMYITRWLTAPSQSKDGDIKSKEGQGTPQGGVVSPLLANVYLHYVLDKRLAKHYPQTAFVRYADDVIVHCKSEAEANQLLVAIGQRLRDCKLRLNEEKTKIVYCQNYRNKAENQYGKKIEVLEENHYYPFGLKHSSYDALRKEIALVEEVQEASTEIKAINPNPGNEIDITPFKNYDYKYNCKAWKDELGLNIYAMDMRMYDPVIARWVVGSRCNSLNSSFSF